MVKRAGKKLQAYSRKIQATAAGGVVSPCVGNTNFASIVSKSETQLAAGINTKR